MTNDNEKDYEKDLTVEEELTPQPPLTSDASEETSEKECAHDHHHGPHHHGPHDHHHGPHDHKHGHDHDPEHPHHHHHHEHDEECGCGCDHDHGHEEEEMDVIVLTLDDGTELECAILEIFPLEEKQYIALVTLDDEQKVLLYEFAEVEDSDEIEVTMIEDEETFQSVAEEFNRLMDEDEDEEWELEEIDEDDEDDEE